MVRGIKATSLAISMVVIALFGLRVASHAQAGGADTHGTPTPAQLAAKDSPATVPIKVTQRAYDMKKLLAAPALSPEATAGRALWQQRCAYCHDGMGQPTYKTMGSWIDSDTVKNM